MHSLLFFFCNYCYIQDIKEKKDEDLLVLPTDAALFDDPSFKVKLLNFFPMSILIQHKIKL